MTSGPAAPTLHRVKVELAHTRNAHSHTPYLRSGLISSDPQNKPFINPAASGAAAITAANDAVIKTAATRDVNRDVLDFRGRREADVESNQVNKETPT